MFSPQLKSDLLDFKTTETTLMTLNELKKKKKNEATRKKDAPKLYKYIIIYIQNFTTNFMLKMYVTHSNYFY